MIIKTNDNEKFNLVMSLDIAFDREEISIHISHTDKRKGTVHGYEFPADEFSKAIRLFEEITQSY